MRTIVIVALSAALAAAIASGLILYQRYHDAQFALMANEKKVAELSAKVSQLREETSALYDQAKELEDVQRRVSELEHTIAQKDHAASELTKAIRTLKTDLTEERKSMQSLEAELASKNALLTGLQKRLGHAQSRAHYLEEQLAEKHREFEGLDVTLRTLRGEKASAETRIDELRATYESLIADLNERIENQEVAIERFEEEISVTFVNRILFEFGKATITPGGGEILKKVGKTLKDVEHRKIRVIGHTDNRSIHPAYRYKYPSNWELSSARASAVVRYLQEEIGFNPAKLEAVGHSFFKPIAANETPEGRARNRRVEIIIAPELE